MYFIDAPLMYTDPDGRAPRNLSETQRDLYKDSIANIDVSKAPAGVVCSTYAAYNFSNAMNAATGAVDSYKELKHDGKNLVGLWGFYASDFYSTADSTENFSFYTDSNGNRDNNFNSPNIEVGTVGVFGTNNPNEFTGHIWTVAGVNRDKDGNVTSLDIVEGHTKSPAERHSVDSKEFNSYIRGTGPFLGWGEFGKNSALSRNYQVQQTEVNTNASTSKE